MYFSKLCFQKVLCVCYMEYFMYSSMFCQLNRIFYIIEFFCLQYLNLTVMLSNLFVQWQACKSLGITFNAVSDNALQMFSSKTSSAISAGTWCNSIVALLLYWELATTLRSNCMILISLLIVSYWLWVKTILKFIDIYKSKNML